MSSELLRQKQKMEMLGRLAAGVAHDFNNLLTAISGYSEFVIKSLPQEDPNRQDLEEIKNNVQRAASLTRQLLAFSRKQVAQPEVVDINATVCNLEKMLHRIIGEDIQICILPSPEPGLIFADVGQIEQIIVNLAVNSRTAMPEGGKITISTKILDLAQAAAKTDVPGKYVLLEFCDTGCGMSPQIVSRIFEPLSAANETDTGPGLPMVAEIIRQLGGRIDAQSSPGRGTNFRLHFPCVRNAEAAGNAEPAQNVLLKGDENILFVDDDGMVRKIARRFLTQNGYTVLAAGSGAEALRLAKIHAGTIHLLATDVIMPDMSGPALAEALASRYPMLKILYFSGYPNKMSRPPARVVSFLSKPFTPENFLRKIRKILDASEINVPRSP